MKCERIISKINKKVKPIKNDICFAPLHIRNNIKVEKNNQKILALDVSLLKDNGAINDAKPTTSRILDILLPTTLPQAIPGDLSTTALTETTNSGNDVPKAIIVIAIN